MRLEPPNDVDQLCADLGVGLKRRARMAEEQGENLVPFLQKLWKSTREHPRLLRKIPSGGGGKTPIHTERPLRGSARSGVRRDVPEPELRKSRRRKVKPPSAAEIEAASEASGYTDNPQQALPHEPEAVPSGEIERYRASRDARDAYQAEQMKEVGDLMAACRELRAAIDAMPAKRKQSMSRTLWMLKGRLDHFEREIRRRAAA